jgi:hypothetical protein
MGSHQRRGALDGYKAHGYWMSGRGANLYPQLYPMWIMLCYRLGGGDPLIFKTVGNGKAARPPAFSVPLRFIATWSSFSIRASVTEPEQ